MHGRDIVLERLTATGPFVCVEARARYGRDIMSTGQPGGGGQTTMPAYDAFHDAVKNGLIKDGWTITDDPLRIEIGLLNVYVDLGSASG
jgi:hypothetical protein